MDNTAVQTLWGTYVWLGTEDVAVVSPVIDALLAGDCADPASVLADPAAVHALFAGAVHQLTGETAEVSLDIQVWRPGHSIGLAYSRGDWHGWCPLAAAAADDEAASGTLSLHDPRSGCAAVTVPALSWGSPLTIKPKPGLVTVHPGWLAYSSTPVLPGHTIVMLFAALHVRNSTSLNNAIQ